MDAGGPPRSAREGGAPDVGSGRPAGVTWRDAQRAAAASWKATSGTLPSTARAAAPYVDKDGHARGAARGFCLPAAHAALNLLPEVRDRVLSLFEELGVPWHAGVDGGPSNHLLSSQVQCANALGQMVDDPERLVRAFGPALGVHEVLPVEPGRWLTFEYVGPTDHFGEGAGQARTRGARCTSVDAAFLHLAADGVVELVLLEWKLSESYRLRAPDPEKDRVRVGRYAAALHDPAGPVRDDLLAVEHLFDEPFYQLVRQQLLAHALEQEGAEGAGRVRVVHVSPAGNLAYQQSLPRPEHRALGGTVSEVWQRLLRHSDRFVSVDSSVFLDERVTSREYVLRYADDVVHDEAQLLERLGLASADDLEDWLYAVHEHDGDVVCRPHEVELRLGRSGRPLAYPFRLAELAEAVDLLLLDLEEEA